MKAILAVAVYRDRNQPDSPWNLAPFADDDELDISAEQSAWDWINEDDYMGYVVFVSVSIPLPTVITVDGKVVHVRESEDGE